MNANSIRGWPAPSCHRTKRARAFTRLELAAVIAGSALLCLVALPLFGTTRNNSDRVACLNNLRLLARAVQIWGADHQNEPSWTTFVSNGGTRPDAGAPFKPGFAWTEFTFLSNEVVTPRILACPADAEAKIASDFIGYNAASFRGLATSYFLNLHSTFEYPAGPLFGDRNVRFFVVGGCNLGVNNAVGASSTETNIVWTNALHGLEGNIVRVDGAATTTTSEELRSAFGRTQATDGTHLLKAR